jgi:hypothetical protein
MRGQEAQKVKRWAGSFNMSTKARSFEVHVDSE